LREQCQEKIGVKNYLDLLDIIKQQEEIIAKQNEMIARLVNETAEQENMISVLMQNMVD
jgi:hypothetical protein